jgi:hypothetical protein
MTEFANLSELLDYLDYHAQDHQSPIEIEQLFNRLSITMKTSGDEKDVEKIRWETIFFSLGVLNGEIRPVRMYDGDGEIHEFPDLKKTDERQWLYLIERLGTSKNQVLKARYSQILWSGPKKHGDYAKVAVDNYLELIKIYEVKDKDLPKENFGLCVLNSFKDAYYLAIIINYKFDEIKSELKRLISSFNLESNFSPTVQTYLIKLALDDKKIFKSEDLAGFDTLCEKIAGFWISRGILRADIDVYELIERWEMKTSGKNSGIWRRKIAESYELMMRNCLEKGDIAVALDFCIEAISNYKKIKAEEKVKELELIYQNNKDKVRYKEISYAIDIKEYAQSCKKFADDLIQRCSSEDLIGFLITEKDLLPNLQIITGQAKELNEKSIAHKIFPITSTDQQNNPAQTFNTDDARLFHSILELYRTELEITKNILIREIIFSAIREGKLTTTDIVEFLKKHSWAGKIHSKKIGNQEIPFSWISLIAPAIDEYFSQISPYYLNNNNNNNITNLVLCIDSLTLKIEGLLRAFCVINNISTSSVKQGGIVREKYLDDLLDEPKIQELFSEDEIMFFKFILIKQNPGFNLRHRIAHSLMIYPEYRIDYMNYLIIAMLLICKYDITINPQEESDFHNTVQIALNQLRDSGASS